MRIHTVVFSGGMDSLTLLTKVRQEFMHDDDKLIVLSFDYGQRHARELDFARMHCVKNKLDWRLINMRFLAQLLPGSSQTDLRVDVPEGAYDAPSMSLTVVPGRNTIMLAMALGVTEAAVKAKDAKLGMIYFGAHAGDHFIYPDCRTHYIAALDRVFQLATTLKIELWAVFQTMTKADIVAEGIKLGVNYAESWTCYKGEPVPCGKCGSCDERREAFKQNGIADPLLAR